MKIDLRIPLFLQDLIRKGIPHNFRGTVWQRLCNAQTCPTKDKYAEYVKSSSPCEKVIKRDIARTYPEHEFFQEKDGPGQQSLFNVMKAYSLHDREVGYCQGTAFIVGLLLLQMPEEEAFTVMVRLMEDYRLREMYKPTMAELGLCMYQLENIVQEILPEIHIHLQSQSFHTSMYASSWFLTVFTASLPFQLACRVMDLLLSEGMESIFRISVAILQFCKEDILQLDMEGMLKYFQKEMPSKCETDPNYIINMALQVKYNSKKMKKLEKEYSTLKAREQEEMIEMRRLRTENRILRQRTQNLEKESTTLAGRLIQGQVSRAQEAEENDVLKGELVALKDKEAALRHELEDAYKQIQELHEVNKTLRENTPDNYIASKLREAEGQLALKELRQQITDLQLMCEQQFSKPETDCSSETSGKEEKTMIAHLREDLLSAKLRETDAMIEVKELRQKVQELEVQNQVNLNQIRRQKEEIKKLQEKIDIAEENNDIQSQQKEERKKNIDLNSEVMYPETQYSRLIPTVALQNYCTEITNTKTSNISKGSCSQNNNFLDLPFNGCNSTEDDELSDQLMQIGKESNHVTSRDLLENGKIDVNEETWNLWPAS
ncbi:ecotropic viral integration site 5 protein homolog [Limulus polyphemus]|uniref:Ecotropic viral integration site 5 protein homolog n=1 Tax=Limulus polyphemus TaxID=6850 RepID=A0ABM1T1X1_LIMPO|nr:ecotropic viral integration site 5 protein homolog [Limulus polyphemus]